MAWLKAITFSNNGRIESGLLIAKCTSVLATAQLHVEYSFYITISCFFFALWHNQEVFCSAKRKFLKCWYLYHSMSAAIKQPTTEIYDKMNMRKRKKCGESKIINQWQCAWRYSTLVFSVSLNPSRSLRNSPSLRFFGSIRFVYLSISTGFCVISLHFSLLHYNSMFSFYLAFVSRSVGSNMESRRMRVCLFYVYTVCTCAKWMMLSVVQCIFIDLVSIRFHLKMILSAFDNTYDWCEFLSSAQSLCVDFMLNHKIIPIQYIVIHVYSSMFAKPIFCLFARSVAFISYCFLHQMKFENSCTADWLKRNEKKSNFNRSMKTS